ncbi:MAG: hypothetical protein M3457_20940 [Chloroflexota bacterium]|nr:hypothetical protein [Chloroflexota bacterium]
MGYARELTLGTRRQVGTWRRCIRWRCIDHVLDQDFTAAVGFQPLNVHTSLAVGGPSGRLTLLRGGMDLATLPTAWEASGYERTTTTGGQDVWTMGGELDFEFDHPIQGRVLASFNNAAILDGEIVAFAPEMTTIEQALAVQRAGDGSVVNLPEFVQPMAPLPVTTVSCFVVRKDILDVASFDGLPLSVWGASLKASDAEVGPMPSYVSIGLGISGGLGGTPDEEDSPVANDTSGEDARVMVTVATASAADAEQAGRVVSHRWSTGESAMTRQPSTDFMNVESVEVEGTVALITFTVVTNQAFWKQMILFRDTYPFVHGSLPQ